MIHLWKRRLDVYSCVILQSCLHEEKRRKTLSHEVDKVGGVLAKRVGGQPLVNAKFGARKIRCLLDTGSKLTNMTESFFQDELEPACQEMLTRDGWLNINAANGLVVLYVGIGGWRCLTRCWNTGCQGPM